MSKEFRKFLETVDFGKLLDEQRKVNEKMKSHDCPFCVTPKSVLDIYVVQRFLKDGSNVTFLKCQNCTSIGMVVNDVVVVVKNGVVWSKHE